MTLGAILWEGPSELDGQPVVVIATGIKPRGKYASVKTGDVIQTWIIRGDLGPHDAAVAGADVSVCGDCKLRRDTQTGSRGCYVNLGPRGPLEMIFSAYRAGSYARLADVEWSEYFTSRKVRLGSYGDPAAVPIVVWWSIVAHVRAWFGYTHAWRLCHPGFRELVMASCDTPEEQKTARLFGWRTFRTRLANERLLEHEIACPASEEMGKRSTCEKCGLCDGRRGEHDRRRDIAIFAHGWSPSVRGYIAARRRLAVLQDGR